jgi:hypothetical protein
MPSSRSSHITIIQPPTKEMVRMVTMNSSTAEKSSSSRSPAMNGCHSRNSPKCTSSHTRWKSPPGVETSAACSASSIASTTQRRRAEIEMASLCAIEGWTATGRLSVGPPTAPVGRPDTRRGWARGDFLG